MNYTEEIRAQRGPPADFVVGREKEKDLAFSGWIVGTGSVGWGPSKRSPPSEWTRSTDVRIYLTAGGKWICQVERRGHRGMTQAISQATIHEKPEEVFKWLTRDGVVGPVTKGAWESVRKTFPSLPELAIERVD